MHLKNKIRYYKYTKNKLPKSNIITLLNTFSYKTIFLNKKWLSIYFQNYLVQSIKTPVILNNIDIDNIFSYTKFKYMLYTLKNFKWNNYRLKNGEELIRVLFVSLYLKNTTLLVKWIKKYFESINLKKHKSLFVFIKILLNYLIWEHNRELRLSGLVFFIKGKIARSGSVRKSKQIIKIGYYSLTNKSLGMYSKKNIIRTSTGVLGLKLDLFF